MSVPVLTQVLTMHMNGGKKFSSLHYEILADGQKTGMRRITRTDGRPRYMKTEDQIVFGDETFDVLATRGVGMLDWIKARLPKTVDKCDG